MSEGQIKRINVLDKGFVDLISSMGNDLTIVNAARVSFGKHKTKLALEDEKLIKYLIEHKHTSPFEHIVFQFRIKCPLFVRGQWHRHRTWSYNEISARYTEVENDYYIPDYFRKQSISNRQASIDASINNNDNIKILYIKQIEESIKTYHSLLQNGVCKEQARAVLPQSMYTTYYGTVDLHNLLHFIRLRIHEGAQFEIQLYAKALIELIEPIVPITMKFFKVGLH